MSSKNIYKVNVTLSLKSDTKENAREKLRRFLRSKYCNVINMVFEDGLTIKELEYAKTIKEEPEETTTETAEAVE